MESPTEIFQAAVDSFKDQLSDRQNEQFKVATLNGVRKQIARMQRERESHKTTLNFKRFQYFLTACEEFDRVCRALDLGIPYLSGYIWGPCCWMLFMVKQDSRALECILEWYFKLGQRLPRVERYTNLLRERPPMKICLAFMYQDLLEFHLTVLGMMWMHIWKKIFVTNWNDRTKSFQDKLCAFDAHRKVLDTLLEQHQQQSQQDSNQRFNNFLHHYEADRDDLNDHILTYRSDRDRLELEIREQEKERKRVQKRDAIAWLTSDHADPEPEILDHNKFKKIWGQHGTIGRWILKEQKIEDWMTSETPSHSMLWMYGIKGAGKTILTSIIIEELRQQGHNTSYYYCRESDKRLNENRFLAICKHLLRQMTGYSDDLLPTMEEMQSGKSGSLNDDEKAKTLIEYFCGTNMKHFIIIDGLDELVSNDDRNGPCDGDRKKLVKFLHSVIEKVDAYKPGKVRLLLVSTDLADMRKLTQTSSNIDIYELRQKKTAVDISNYVSSKLSDLRGDNQMVEVLDRAEATICKNAQGVFLYAVLVIANIVRRRDTLSIRRELDGDRIPRNLAEAYKKTIQSLQEDQEPEDWEFAKKIFGWLACAKRPLKMRELLAINSIIFHDDGRTQSNYTSRLEEKIRDACGPLVYVDQRNRVEFIHQTASHYILQSEYMDQGRVECDLMLFCLRYLSQHLFHLESSMEERSTAVKKKYYAFQDYAVSMWSSHMKSMIELSAGLFNDPSLSHAYKQKVNQIIWQFFQVYHVELKIPDAELRKESTKRCKREAEEYCRDFKYQLFHDSLVQLWTHVVRHEGQQDSKARAKVSMERLNVALKKNREAVQKFSEEVAPGQTKDSFIEYYGGRLYKCELVTCDYFYEGFGSEEDVKRHMNQHDRPYTCPVNGCSNAPYGFTTEKDRKKHMRNYHRGILGEQEDFPRILRTLPSDNAKFRCDLCQAKFTRKVALVAHKDSEHLGQRPFACSTCERAFVRRYDCRRHERTVHSGHSRRGGQRHNPY